jgi:hypothetical protein
VIRLYLAVLFLVMYALPVLAFAVVATLLTEDKR